MKALLRIIWCALRDHGRWSQCYWGNDEHAVSCSRCGVIRYRKGPGGPMPPGMARAPDQPSASPNIAESNDRADDALSILRDLNDIASDFGGYVPPDKIVQALKRAGIKPHDYVAMVADVRALTSAPPPATPAYEWRISRTADLSGEGWEECEPPDGRIEEFRDHRFWRRVRAANQPPASPCPKCYDEGTQFDGCTGHADTTTAGT